MKFEDCTLADLLRMFANDLAQAIAPRLESHLKEHFDALINSDATTPHLDRGKMALGLEINGLYSVSEVAQRWGVRKDYVRRCDRNALPRSGWRGGEIRYRGIDILRFEGVDLETQDQNLPDERAPSPAPDRPPSGDGASCEEGSRSTRPYQCNLPSLDDL